MVGFRVAAGSISRVNTWNKDQTFDGKILLADGSIANPAFTFDLDRDTGIFKQAPGVLGITSDGVEVLRLSGVLFSVNCFNLLPAVAGSSPIIEVAGSDDDIPVTIRSKGTSPIIIDGQMKINGGSPGVGKVLTDFDGNGLAVWTLPAGGGFTDVGATIILTNINDDVGIGVSSPNAKLEVGGTPGASVGGFPSGQLHVTNPSASVNANSVVTGHNLNGGNKQLWYFGNTSSSNDNIALINRQDAELHFHTNDAVALVIKADLKIGIGTSTPSERLEINGNIKVGTVIDTSIYAQLSSSVDQEPGDTNPTVITYNIQDAIAGLTHSTSVNPGEITIVTAGLYEIVPQPQVGKTSGATRVDFDMFLQVDRGSGFVDEPNSNIKLAIKDQDVTDVIVSVIKIELDVDDIIRMMQRVTNSGVGMGLKNTDAEVGPPTIPRTPSIIFAMERIGGIPA